MNRIQAGWVTGFLAAITVMVFTGGAFGATYYWGGGNVAIGPGTPFTSNSASLMGTWDLTTANWATSPSGASYVAWPNTGNDTVWLPSFTNSSPNLAGITQRVDLVLSGLVADISQVGNFNSYYEISATNSRTIT